MTQPGGIVWQLDWPHGRAEIQELGGMLGPVWFRFDDGREFQPMHVAPWADEVRALGLTGLLSCLRGEWPCVPFGGTVVPSPMPEGWIARAPDDDGFFHGFAAHNRWAMCDRRDDCIHIAIEYPESSPIMALHRWIQASPDGPALRVKLDIHVRRAVDLPVALHLTFRLPEIPGSLQISGEEIEQVMSYPIRLESDVSRLRPDAGSASLRAVESVDGALDLSCLPLPFRTEELVQLVKCRSAIRLQYLREGANVVLDWDRGILPDAVLWLSNGGRLYPPWSGRNFALGVEPVAGPFDLGRVAIPPPGHPVANRLLKLRPDHPTTVVYPLTANASSMVSGSQADSDRMARAARSA